MTTGRQCPGLGHNAVAQPVWKLLDADADRIKVRLFENEMGLEKLTVS